MIDQTIAPTYSPDDFDALSARQADEDTNRYICIEDKTVLTVTENGLRCPKCSYTLKRVPREAYVVVDKTTGDATVHTRYADEKKHQC